MWNKLEKVYKKYINKFGDNAIHFINLLICLKLSNNNDALTSFDDFVFKIKSIKLNLVLGITLDKNWRYFFNEVKSDLNNIHIKDETDIKNIGYLFEKLVNRKENGTYYTPYDVTNYITKNTILNSLLIKLNKNNLIINSSYDTLEKSIFNSNISKIKIIKTIKELKILDPTCGSGAFLLTAFETIFELLKKLSNSDSSDSDLAVSTLQTLHGVDIEPKAIAITKTLLLMEILIVDGKNGFDNFPWNNFKVGNTLWGDTTSTNSKTYLKHFKKSEILNNEKPFLWKKEFRENKFDCIIGNPPYVELAKAKKNYNIDTRLKSGICGNIYAMVLERSLELIATNGVLGMIIPISFISTPRMDLIFQEVKNNSERFYVASFGDRPSCLFSGVHQKLNILFVKKGKGGQLFTSSYFHWSKNERNDLFKKVKYVENKERIKIGNDIEKRILTKVRKHKNILSNYFYKNPTSSKLYINIRACFFIKTNFYPQNSNEFKEFYFENENIKFLVNAIINSNIAFFLWEVFGDGWHLKPSFDFINFDLKTLNNNDLSKLEFLSKKLNKNLEKNKVKINTKQTEYEYKHKMAKKIMDKIDNILGRCYGFTKQELFYLKQYNAKFRLNDYYSKYIISIK